MGSALKHSYTLDLATRTKIIRNYDYLLLHYIATYTSTVSPGVTFNAVRSTVCPGVNSCCSCLCRLCRCRCRHRCCLMAARMPSIVGASGTNMVILTPTPRQLQLLLPPPLLLSAVASLPAASVGTVATAPDCSSRARMVAAVDEPCATMHTLLILLSSSCATCDHRV